MKTDQNLRDLPEWPEFIKRVSLRLPFVAKIDAFVSQTSDDFEIRVALRIPCIHTQEPIWVTTREVVPSTALLTEKQAMSMVQAAVREAMRHEADESVFVDGKQWSDPHVQVRNH